MTDEELERISRKLELASAEFADAKSHQKLWEWVLPLYEIGEQLVSEIRRLKAAHRLLSDLILAEEREACAKVADKFATTPGAADTCCWRARLREAGVIAAAIRARGKE